MDYYTVEKNPNCLIFMNLEAVRTHLTPAPDSIATVAPFRAWRG